MKGFKLCINFTKIRKLSNFAYFPTIPPFEGESSRGELVLGALVHPLLCLSKLCTTTHTQTTSFILSCS